MDDLSGLVAQALDEVEMFAAVLGEGGVVQHANQVARREARVEPLGRPFIEAWPALEAGQVAVQRAASGARVRFRARVPANGDPSGLVYTAAPGAVRGAVVLTARPPPYFAALKAACARLEDALITAAHELRGPLLAAQLLSETVRARATEPDPLLDRLLGCLGHACQLADRLLRASGDEPPMRPEPLDLAEVARRAVDLFRPLCAGRIIELLENGAPVPILADRTQIEEVLGNLLANAGRHTPPGTHVVVRVGVEEERAALVVEDDGPGIAPGQAARLFRRFSRARPAERGPGTAGLGVGLFLCARIVRGHGGTIRAGDRPGGGARFEVRLPLAAPELRLAAHQVH